MKKILICLMLIIPEITYSETFSSVFDGNGVYRLSVSDEDLKIKNPSISVVRTSYDEEGPENAFWKNAKCIDGSCETGHNGYYCNLKTCGLSVGGGYVNERTTVKMNFTDKFKNIINNLSKLTVSDKKKIIDSFEINEKGEIKNIDMSPIFNNYGDLVVDNIMKEIYPSQKKSYVGDMDHSSNDEPDPSYIPDDYIKNAKCVSKGTCVSENGYVCGSGC